MPAALEVGCAVGLLLLTALFAWLKNLGLGKDFLWAGLRMAVQLLLLGVILHWIILHPHAWLIITVALVMSVNAAIHSTTRVRRRYPGLIVQNLTTTFLVLWPFSLLGLWLLSPHNKLDPAIVLPLLGMILGNSLNGVTLGFDHFTAALKERREQLLSLIALGATPSEATHGPLREALRHSMTPVLNAMLACGIISIPGMMTGQVIAGVTPMNAAIYQLIMMIIISCGGFAGAYVGLKLCQRKHFNRQGSLC